MILPLVTTTAVVLLPEHPTELTTHAPSKLPPPPPANVIRSNNAGYSVGVPRIWELSRRFDPRTTLRKGAIHGECSNHWAWLLPRQKTLVFREIVTCSDRSPSVEHYLAVHGNKFTDDAEHQIERPFF
jgi:hypothetical protein